MGRDLFQATLQRIPVNSDVKTDCIRTSGPVLRARRGTVDLILKLIVVNVSPEVKVRFNVFWGFFFLQCNNGLEQDVHYTQNSTATLLPLI